MNHLSNDNPLYAVESSLASKGYPQEAKLLLETLFGEFTGCYIEIRLLYKGRDPIRLFYPSVDKIQRVTTAIAAAPEVRCGRLYFISKEVGKWQSNLTRWTRLEFSG